MKKLILVFLVAILTTQLNAQSKGSIIYGEAVTKYRKMEIAGTILTAIGGAAFFTGNVLYWKSYNNHSLDETVVSKAGTYKGIIYGGLGLMAVGIPVWSIAKSKERHISIDAQLVKFRGLASATGVGFKIRF
jgi:hypothetical protein